MKATSFINVIITFSLVQYVAKTWEFFITLFFQKSWSSSSGIYATYLPKNCYFMIQFSRPVAKLSKSQLFFFQKPQKYLTFWYKNFPIFQTPPFYFDQPDFDVKAKKFCCLNVGKKLQFLFTITMFFICWVNLLHFSDISGYISYLLHFDVFFLYFKGRDWIVLLCVCVRERSSYTTQLSLKFCVLRDTISND